METFCVQQLSVLIAWISAENVSNSLCAMVWGNGLPIHSINCQKTLTCPLLGDICASKMAYLFVALVFWLSASSTLSTVCLIIIPVIVSPVIGPFERKKHADGNYRNCPERQCMGTNCSFRMSAPNDGPGVNSVRCSTAIVCLCV